LDEFVEEIPFTETRRYVKRVLMSYGIYETLYGQGAPRIHGGKLIAKAPVVGAMQVAGAAPIPAPSPSPSPDSSGAGTAGTPGAADGAGGAAAP
ncbi:MAG TPA: hypothetical protein VMV18_14655, partial [bacterium]|nr:hypothetical protein [bacterium]